MCVCVCVWCRLILTSGGASVFDHQCLLTSRQGSSPSPCHTHTFTLMTRSPQGMALKVREKVEVKWPLICPVNRTVRVCVSGTFLGTGQLKGAGAHICEHTHTHTRPLSCPVNTYTLLKVRVQGENVKWWSWEHQIFSCPSLLANGQTFTLSKSVCVCVCVKAWLMKLLKLGFIVHTHTHRERHRQRQRVRRTDLQTWRQTQR